MNVLLPFFNSWKRIKTAQSPGSCRGFRVGFTRDGATPPSSTSKGQARKQDGAEALYCGPHLGTPYPSVLAAVSLESTGLPSSCSFSFLIASITTQLATLARGQQRVTDPNLQGALGVGFNRVGNCLVKTPAPQPTPAPPDAADPRAASAELQGCPLQSSTQGSEVHTQGHLRAAVRGWGRLGPRQRPHPPLVKGKILKKRHLPT